MSPEQIPILQEYQRTGKLPDVSINAFKSGMYSVGITFLQLALLEPPVQLLIGDRDAAITSYLGQLQANYPKLSLALYYMLLKDPVQRPDFPQIVEYLSHQNPVILTVNQQQATGVVSAPKDVTASATPEYYQPGSEQWGVESAQQGSEVTSQPPTQACGNCQQTMYVSTLQPIVYEQVTYMMCPTCYAQYSQSYQEQPTVTPPQNDRTTNGQPQGYPTESVLPPDAPPFKTSICRNCGHSNSFECASEDVTRVAFCPICYSPAPVVVVAAES